MGAAAGWLASVHADIIQDVAKDGLQYLRELLRCPLVKHLFEAQHVHVGWEEGGHFPGYTALLTETLGQQSSGGAPVALLVGILIGVENGIRLHRGFLGVITGHRDLMIAGLWSGRVDLRCIHTVPHRGLGCGECADGWTESSAAAGGVDINANIGSAHALGDALADGGCPVLGVSQVVETSQAVWQKTQVGCSKSKRHPCFQLQAPTCLLLWRGWCFLMVGKGPATGLERCPQQKTDESQGSRGQKKDEERNGTKKDLEWLEIAFLLHPLGPLQSGGLAHGD